MKKIFLKIITSAAVLAVVMCMCASVFAFASDQDIGTEADASEQIMSADRDTYIYGLAGYAQRDQIIRNLPKKSVAYVTQILDGSNMVVAADSVTKGSYYRYSLVEGIATFNPEALKSCRYLGGITYDFFSEAEIDAVRQETSADGNTVPYYIVSADELMNADIIVTVGCIPLTAMMDSLGSREYKGIIISDVPAAFADEAAEDADALTRGYYLGSAFSEVLNPVEICAYYYQHFLGFEDEAALKEKVDSVFASTTFFRGYSNKLGEGYDKTSIEDMLVDGTHFYLDNRSVFSGGAFDANGMSSWEPDLAMAGSILGPDAAETEQESETADETEAAVTDDTETEAESVSETEPETEAEAKPDDGTEADSGTGQETGSEQELPTVTETETAAEIPVYELPKWVGPAAAGAVVAAGLVIYIIYMRKKD